MKAINANDVQSLLTAMVDTDVYLHLETTNGSYAALHDENAMSVCVFIRNDVIRFERASIQGSGPYRVGLKLPKGWVYATGLTDYEVNDRGELLLAGHDADGRLAVGLELSRHPFRE
ncbi:MAG: YojF family protein [Alicyclobacillus sp.]|nr:YojF family protein [Alicyclobacillus sp.]